MDGKLGATSTKGPKAYRTHKPAVLCLFCMATWIVSVAARQKKTFPIELLCKTTLDTNQRLDVQLKLRKLLFWESTHGDQAKVAHRIAGLDDVTIYRTSVKAIASKRKLQGWALRLLRNSGIRASGICWNSKSACSSCRSNQSDASSTHL